MGRGDKRVRGVLTCLRSSLATGEQEIGVEKKRGGESGGDGERERERIEGAV
jgi:hypothetical protein